MAKLIKLKNGIEEAESLITIVMMSLQKLFNENPMAVYELVMKCRDNNHQYFGNMVEELKTLALVQSDGSVHNSIRNIVLSAVKGEGLKMVLGSPILEEKDIKK